MKSTQFFLDKAIEYRDAVNRLTTSFETIMNKKYGIETEENSEEFSFDERHNESTERSKTVSYWFVRVKLMLGEFDNAEPFIEWIDRTNTRGFTVRSLYELDRLEALEQILDAFIEHLETWRQEPDNVTAI